MCCHFYKEEGISVDAHAGPVLSRYRIYQHRSHVLSTKEASSRHVSIAFSM